MKKSILIIVFGSLMLMVLLAVLYIGNKPGDFDPDMFVLNENLVSSQQYLTCSSMDEMNMLALNPFDGVASDGSKDGIQEIECPINLTYYFMDNGQLKKAFTIKKGSIINVNAFEMGNRRGLLSFPTFTKGLRYAKPFTVNSEEPDQNYYYVHLRDLERICRDYYTKDELKMRMLEERGLSVKEAVHDFVRTVDRIFYTNGVYCSLD